MKICLDAGHYGKYNRSPVVPAYYESDMTWKLHLKLKAELEKYKGVEVITTRADKEKDKGLVARGQTAKGCDLFISLHSNGVTGKEQVDYPVVYFPVSGACSDLAHTLAKFIEDTMGTVQDGKAYSRKSTDGKYDYYSVIFGAVSVGTPGLIIEHSFHTNTKAAKWLLDDGNLDKLAVGEAAILAKYYGLKKKPAEKPAEEPAEKTIYRVQTGAFHVKAYADDYLAAVRAAGFPDAYMVQVDDWYKIQVGAFAVKANAESYMAKVKAAGFSAFITTEGGKAVQSTAPAKKSVDEIAMEVIRGNWGNGAERKKRLEAAGYNYAEVQKAVNRLKK